MDVKEYNIETAHNKQNHPWEYARFEVMLDLLSNTVEKKEELNIIDIGCGDAFFLYQLSKHFKKCNFFAVDTAFTQENIIAFQEKYKDANIQFYQNLSEIKCAKVDLIFLMDVIEHIKDDIDFLSSLHTLSGLHQDTVVAVTVPAFQSLFTLHDEWLGHERRYTVKILKQHLCQAGFEACKSGYFFFSLLLPRVIQKMKNEMIKSNQKQVSGIGDWNGSRFTSAMLKNVLVMDYKFSKLLRYIGIKLPGLSCYAISKPKNR